MAKGWQLSNLNLSEYIFNLNALRKHAYSNILKISPQKKKKKKTKIFR